jgi:hypothetical protein
MATNNQNLNISQLDFAGIKSSLTTFLQGQDTFKDYNFSGSGLSVLLDILTYNTQYNAFYLNQVANEMFLDSALQRSSVVSHAKELAYTPKSAIAPTSEVNLVVSGVSDTFVSLPRFSTFISEAINNRNYSFVTLDSQTVPVVSGTANFGNLLIKQGVPVTQTLTYSLASNPNSIFVLPDANIDTTTIQVLVYPNPSSPTYEIYNQTSNYLGLNGESNVFFLSESITGYYQIQFGDGIIGSQLSDGSAIIVSYITTSGTAASGANNFVLTTPVNGTVLVNPLTAASSGSNKESIDSIKFTAPKTYSAQGRAVTKDDYITLIQQNNLGYAFDAVNVWGGEENNPPVYGSVFISLKPAGAYALTDTQKNLLLNSVINPISILTVQPTIIDPDYTYIKISTNVLYDAKKTQYSYNQLQSIISNTVTTFASATLNTFNSTFIAPELENNILNSDPSIITNEFTIQLQKKFYPNLTTPTNYVLDFGVPLAKGLLLSGVSSTPTMTFNDPVTPGQTISGVSLEEVPSAVGGIASIKIINPGFSYQYAPTVTIIGDGTGATAYATINAKGQLQSINVIEAGFDYTSASIVITPQANDTSGQLGAAIAVLEGQYGVLRTYYINSTLGKVILNPNAGTIDYVNGVLTLNAFYPVSVDNPLGQLAVTVNPETTIISSSLNKIITVDPFDSTAIEVNLTAKNS